MMSSWSWFWKPLILAPRTYALSLLLAPVISAQVLALHSASGREARQAARQRSARSDLSSPSTISIISIFVLCSKCFDSNMLHRMLCLCEVFSSKREASSTVILPDSSQPRAVLMCSFCEQKAEHLVDYRVLDNSFLLQ